MKPKKTILCVDNNEQHLSIRKVVLETRGYRVVACNSGREALQQFKDHRAGVDLVLTDLHVPDVDGVELIERIKDISPNTPAVLLSAKAKVYEREHRADLFLTRDMHAPADLLEKIRILLVKKRGPKPVARIGGGSISAAS
jgi:CheY-like chemotaxis protein